MKNVFIKTHYWQHFSFNHENTLDQVDVCSEFTESYRCYFNLWKQNLNVKSKIIFSMFLNLTWVLVKLTSETRYIHRVTLKAA